MSPSLSYSRSCCPPASAGARALSSRHPRRIEAQWKVLSRPRHLLHYRYRVELVVLRAERRHPSQSAAYHRRRLVLRVRIVPLSSTTPVFVPILDRGPTATVLAYAHVLDRAILDLPRCPARQGPPQGLPRDLKPPPDLLPLLARVSSPSRRRESPHRRQ